MELAGISQGLWRVWWHILHNQQHVQELLLCAAVTSFDSLLQWWLLTSSAMQCPDACMAPLRPPPFPWFGRRCTTATGRLRSLRTTPA